MPANIRFKSTNKCCVEIWIWGKIPSDYLWSDTRLGCPLVRCGPANRYCNICFLFSKPLANMQTDIAIYDVICHYLFQQEWRRRPVKNISFSKSIRTRTSREVGTLQQVAWAVLSYTSCVKLQNCVELQAFESWFEMYWYYGSDPECLFVHGGIWDV